MTVRLQTPGGVIYFLHHHRGFPVTSPAVFGQIGDQFRRAVSSYAEANFYTKVHDRVLAPPQLRTALRAIEQHIDERLAQSRLPAAA